MRTRSNAYQNRATAMRLRLAAQLSAEGHLRSPEWRAAVEAVPRHEFVPEFWVGVSDDEWGVLWEAVSRHTSEDRWLELAYTDQSLVTQLDGDRTPAGPRQGRVTGAPTSSSTMPSLVVRMWEELQVTDDSRVLEIGTGTGYSTGLGCYRLGDNHIASVEVDAGVAENARVALESAGYHPRLIVGDGLAGHPSNCPYDRIIATCSVRHVPPVWITQTRPGGMILATIWGWMWSTGRTRLVVGEDGTAEGRFFPTDLGFMPARAHTAPAIGEDVLNVGEDAEERATTLGPEILSTRMGRFVAQLTIPKAQHQPVVFQDDGSTIDYLIDSEHDSRAAIVPEPGGGFVVRQSGPIRLWDEVENAVAEWCRAGEPGIEHFAIRVTQDSQTIWLDQPGARLSGRLRHS